MINFLGLSHPKISPTKGYTANILYLCKLGRLIYSYLCKLGVSRCLIVANNVILMVNEHKNMNIDTSINLLLVSDP